MRRMLILVAGAAVVAALATGGVVAFQFWRSDDPDLATQAPEIVMPEGGSAVSTSLDPIAGARKFVIEPADSGAKYVVEEKLRGGIITKAVGTTSTISGEICLTPDGVSKEAQSKFVVDLSTLRSDESQRDHDIKQNILVTSSYPNAEFVIESTEGFPATYVENSQVVLTVQGTLTIRGVAKPVSWTVLARQSGNTLTATADTDISFTEFDMTPPSLPFATVEDAIHLQVVLVAREPAF
jgi:polyisoprenoid-binding protein YceI